MSHINTKCIQSGYTPKNGEPRVLPICQSTTYKYDSSEHLGDLFDLKVAGHMYSRISNPTVDAVEKKIADLEGGTGCVLCSSGQAANLLAILNINYAGQNIISLSSIYGGTVAGPVWRAIAERSLKYMNIPPNVPLPEKKQHR